MNTTTFGTLNKQISDQINQSINQYFEFKAKQVHSQVGLEIEGGSGFVPSRPRASDPFKTYP